MKLFLESANLDEIRQAADWGILDGVALNAALAATASQPLAELIEEICGIVDGFVSAEAGSTETAQLVKEGRELAKIHDSVVVKIPFRLHGLKAVKALAEEGIRCEVSECFQPTQALLAAKAGAYCLSADLEQFEALGEDGFDFVEKVRQIFDHYEFDTQILAAGVRGPLTATHAALAGADGCAMPFAALALLFQRPLADLGLDLLHKDAAKAPQRQAASARR